MRTDITMMSLIHDKGVLWHIFWLNLVGIEEVEELGRSGRGGRVGGESNIVGRGAGSGLSVKNNDRCK